MPRRDDSPNEHNPDGDGIELSQSEIARFADDALRQIKTMADKFKEVGQYSDPTSANFYVCLVFISDEQKNAFLKAVGIGPNIELIDGVEVCKTLGIDLPPAMLKEKARNAEFDQPAMMP